MELGLNKGTGMGLSASQLNPLAEEFLPAAHTDAASSTLSTTSSFEGSVRKDNRNKHKAKNLTTRANLVDNVRRTVYVSNIDLNVTEVDLAALFINCGQVVDCRVCGVSKVNVNSPARFGFLEFTDQEGAVAALKLSGTILGHYPISVSPSRTGIVPVNATFLAESEDERDMCARTVYCTNVDKADVKAFLESFCGKIARLRLLEDTHQSTMVAFVEFELAESAITALHYSGCRLGALPIRVNPSKTPARSCSQASALPRPT